MKKAVLISASLCLLITIIVTLSSSYNTFWTEVEDPKFKDRWEKVDSLEKKGLYRQAMAEVGSIFNKAVEAELHNQVIKSVLFELKYNAYLEEDDYVLGISKLDELIKKAPSPSKEILHSLIAEVYWGYYSSNQWKFQNRTNVVEVDLKDIRTWDLKRIAEKVRNHYLLSLKNRDNSQSRSITEFDEIITYADEGADIRPTLFDFLAHRALDFFKTNKFNIPGPAETFTLEEAQYFAGNPTFLSLKPATKDSFNTDFFGTILLKELTRFHRDEENRTPLFYVELERLKFMHAKSVHPEKDELHYTGLQRMTNAYQNHPEVTEAWYEIAVVHNNNGNSYNHLQDTTSRWEKKRAVEICNKTIEKYPDAYGTRQCEALKNGILQKDLRLYAEEAIAVNQKSKFLLEYKNVDTLYLKIAQFDYKDVNEIRNRSSEEFRKDLQKSKSVYTKTLILENPGDYQKHSVEELIPELENGLYYIIVGSDKEFEFYNNAFSYIPVWVSDITYQHRRNGKSHEVLVSDRRTGTPLSNADVEVRYQKYNYKKYRYEYKTYGNYTTNENGKINFSVDKDYQTYSFKIEHKDQVYAPTDGVYSYRYYENNRNYNTSRIFTDRMIYRPGQTIYFKGIILNYDKDKRELLTNHTTTVYFYDVNGEEIAHKEVTTNAFGSYQGTFTAPFGVLTGQMRIYDSYGTKYFRVEEYKRPKFFVEMDPVEGEFKVNDEITATGKAQAYAGNRIDGADIKYRIVRTTNYNRWHWWGWRPYTPPKEIDRGSLKTDENGEFEIQFNALPDKTADPEQLPIFTYTVYVDVTDINGEVHSTTTSIVAGYQSLKLGTNLLSEMNNEDDFFLRLSTTNLNGQDIPASGSLSISKLKTPQRPYYQRLWAQPDMQKWTEEEFRNLFPNEVYRDENNMYLWPKGKEVFNTTFNTAKTDSIPLNKYKSWKPGVYVYEATSKDKNGIEVKDKFYFTLFNPSAKVAPKNHPLWVKSLKYSYEVGETAEILIGTAEKDMRIAYEVEVQNQIISSEIINLSEEQRKLSIPVKEAYRGNFTVHFSSIKNNRRFGQSVNVNVPYTNKQLDLEFSTFRNKLLPGEKEKWTLTVKNKKGEKENAELLATLYDASLDALYTSNSFSMSIYDYFYGAMQWSDGEGMTQKYSTNYHDWNRSVSYPYRYFPTMDYQGWNSYYYGGYYRYRGAFAKTEMDAYNEAPSEEEKVADMPMGGAEQREGADKDMEDSDDRSGEIVDEATTLATGVPTKNGKKELSRNDRLTVDGNREQQGQMELNNVKARTNFNETAFFKPQLNTDADGNVEISFTIPESLTKWRFLGMAHTKDLKIGSIREEVVTQKELMVVPNTPRFLREGDKITLSCKVSNISEKDLEGKIQLSLSDPFVEKSLDEKFALSKGMKSFKVEAGKSESVSWTIKVPYEFSAVKYKFVAKADDFSDGEENVLPILSNRMMVTEALPMPIRGEETKQFKFEKLMNSANSSTLRHHRYTLEFTSNPAWYALQAMPYMMEYPYECSEQVFTRYYSNAIATHVLNSSPKIKKVIEDWGENSPEAFLSNLQKNQELKSVMLEETPWVLDAKNEEQSKKNLAVLLDMERMSRELNKALGKTIKSQSANGGWPWFPGMRESRYITQHIITGMGHLDHLGIKDIREDRRVWKMIKKGVSYLDRQIRIDYQNAKKYDPDYLTNQHIGYTQIQYLYARSYFPKINMDKNTMEAVDYYRDQAKKFWLNFNIYAEGMIALGAHRFGMDDLASDIVKSLKDRSIDHDEFGMYWKDYYVGYYWYEAPVETQALMIEMFDEVANDQESVEELKIWLLKEKQTTNWKTTKQTTEAVYALLLKGSNLLASDELVQITVGGKDIQYKENPSDQDPYQVKTEAGTGYFKTHWNKEEVKPKMGEITVKKKDKGIAWGAAYWQYFEDLDKITFAENNLKLKKQLFLVELTDEGEVLKPVNENNVLHVGDKVRVRIELRTDRNLEYVHMKDMRASGFEPLNVLSRYYYQDGLGYYQATKDAATNFFFDYVPKGTHVFEYSMWVQHKGDFSNGITSIQCMYAPEFTSHSDGIRVKVE